MRALVLLSLIACGRDPAPASSSSSPAASRFAGIEAALARGDAPDTTSVLVMRAGEIEYEGYFEGATAETLHDTRSAMKSVTSLAVGIAIGRGVLPGLDAKALAYVNDLAPFAHDGPAKAAITIGDLVTMSSALDCNDDDPDSPGNEENMYPRKHWVRWAVDLPTKPYRRDARGRGPFSYCTAGTVLLGQIIERAARLPIDRFIATHLFAPLGITRWEFPRSPSGEVMTGGGLRLRTRDLATIAWMVRQGGAWNGAQVVPAAYVRDALTVHHHNAFADQDYGYLFWRRTYRSSCGEHAGWYMSGNGGNAIVILAELDAVVVVTRTHYNARGMHQQTSKLLEQHVLPALCR